MAFTIKLPRFDFIYLASQSPRRRELLDQVGIRYQLLPPDPHENAEALEEIQAAEKPVDYVQRVTQAKLGAALRRHREKRLAKAPILCADTIVCQSDKVYGKPRDQEHACQILNQLQGGLHLVMTAVAVAVPGESFTDSLQRLSTSSVSVCAMSAYDIDCYIASKEPFGKAGAYAIQGKMAAYIDHIDGSYSGIMGLPLYETMQLLKLVGV